MASAAERILDGFRQALSFARGECKHDWEDVIVRDYARANHISRTRQCKKCKVRYTEFEARKIRI